MSSYELLNRLLSGFMCCCVFHPVILLYGVYLYPNVLSVKILCPKHRQQLCIWNTQHCFMTTEGMLCVRQLIVKDYSISDICIFKNNRRWIANDHYSNLRNSSWIFIDMFELNKRNISILTPPILINVLDYREKTVPAAKTSIKIPLNKLNTQQSRDSGVRKSSDYLSVYMTVYSKTMCGTKPVSIWLRIAMYINRQARQQHSHCNSALHYKACGKQAFRLDFELNHGHISTYNRTTLEFMVILYLAVVSHTQHNIDRNSLQHKIGSTGSIRISNHKTINLSHSHWRLSDRCQRTRNYSSNVGCKPEDASTLSARNLDILVPVILKELTN
ncbi:hypothetical protein Bhyg_12073 [Pseudolycoriella hygida]|uniref:Uncharacterized protein n=1 Tax=Pseudolycoriella hygida TaxID=35572 RepID=A0A9Q0MXI6_9DIPT|nr:hypothetical protein Bhyg_12073 [Pseudolycoriella hygida]